MKKHRLTALILLFIFSLAIGCRAKGPLGIDEENLGRRSNAPAPIDGSSDSPEDYLLAKDAKRPEGKVDGDDETLRGGELGDKRRKLIYTAKFRIQVEDFEKGFKQVKEITKEVEGFIAHSHSKENQYKKRSGTVVIRVPEKYFDLALQKLRGVGKVKSERLRGQDVTEEYFDLEARLKNKRELETRLLHILKTRTGKLSELLEVEKELARVREEIERMEGRKRFLNDRIKLATITVDLLEPTSIAARSQWNPLSGAFKKAVSVFSNSLGTLVLIIVGLIPWLLLTWIIVSLSVRWYRRRKSKKIIVKKES